MRTLILMMGLTACGGGFTGVNGNKTFTELTDEEVCQVFEETENYAGGQFDDSDACVLSGQFAGAFAVAFDPEADFVAACEAAVTECEETGPEPVEPFECNADDYAVPDTCTATVADHEACTEAQIDAIKEMVALGCDEAILEMDENPTETPPECAVFYSEECSG